MSGATTAQTFAARPELLKKDESRDVQKCAPGLICSEDDGRDDGTPQRLIPGSKIDELTAGRQ